MSTETERLAQEAEQRRSNLDATLESLKGKLSPGQVVDELAAYVRDGQGADMVKNLNRQVRDNPLALGLIGAGAAWLLFGQGVRDNGHSIARRYEDRHDDDRVYPIQRYEGGTGAYADESYDRSAAGSTYAGSTDRHGSGLASGLNDKAHSAASSVGSAASNAAGAVSGAASSVASSVSDAASSVADSANRLSHDTRDAAYRAGQAGYRGVSSAGEQAAYYGRRAQRSFLDTLQEEPLILGAVAVAIGAAIGAALPSTRVEDEWLGQTRDKLRDEAIESGRDVAEKAKGAAESAYRAGSEEADAKGLKPDAASGETLAQKVSSVAHAAAGAAREELSSSSKDGEKTGERNA